jgi:hypothetical protein
MANNPIIMVDPRGENPLIVAVIVGAVVGGYIGGTIVNEGELNPLAWDWESGNTYKGILIGGIVGGATGYVSYQAFFASSPWLGISGAVSTPIGSVGLATDGLSNDVNFSWNTVAGGGGSAILSPDPYQYNGYDYNNVTASNSGSDFMSSINVLYFEE